MVDRKGHSQTPSIILQAIRRERKRDNIEGREFSFCVRKMIEWLLLGRRILRTLVLFIFSTC